MIWYMCKYTPLELFAGFSAPTERLPEETDDFERRTAWGIPISADTARRCWRRPWVRRSGSWCW